MQINKGKKLHMFQKTDDINSQSKVDYSDLDDQFRMNLAKISISYRSRDKGQPIKTNSLVNSAKGLIETSRIDLAKPLSDYINQVQSQFEIHLPDFAKFETKKTNEKEDLNANAQSDYRDEKALDIDEIIKNTEKELLSSSDQKSVLLNLIDDINANSTNNIYYDDHKFERNMKEIIQETQDVGEEITVETEPPIEYNDQSVKKSRRPLALLAVMLLLLVIAGYLYRGLLSGLFK